MIDPVNELKKLKKQMSQRQMAMEIGVSEPYLSMVMRGKKPPSPRVLLYLGLERVQKVRKVR